MRRSAVRMAKRPLGADGRQLKFTDLFISDRRPTSGIPKTRIYEITLSVLMIRINFENLIL
jgi:hypothetical protein